ncbi:MAG: hypothetical protein WA081_10905, partial [Desulfosalsimonadaceae bacterium]
CLKKPNKMIERSESSLNNPENNCHSQNNQKNQLHFFWKSTPAPDDGTHIEKAWNSAGALSEDEILDP